MIDRRAQVWLPNSSESKLREKLTDDARDGWKNRLKPIPGSGYQTGDILITKRPWGAFYGTELEQQLRRQAIRTIILGGVATNFGVESTAHAAFDYGYELILVEDAMSNLKAEAHSFAVQNIFPRMGRVRTAKEVLLAFAL